MPWVTGNAATEAPQRISVLTDGLLEGLTSGKIVYSDAAPTIAGVTQDNFHAYVVDLLWAVIEEHLTPEAFPVAIKAAGFADRCSGVLANVFWLIWADIEGPRRNAFLEEPKSEPATAALDEPAATRMVDVVHQCRQQGVVTDADLFEHVDLRLLVQLGLAVNHGPPMKQFRTRITVAKQSRIAKITQYNAFREESEGYAKLLTLLNNAAIATAQGAAAAAGIGKEVDQLTGYFDLSPMKVVFCIMAAIESSPSSGKVLMSLKAMDHTFWCDQAVTIRLRFSDDGPMPAFFSMAATLLRHGKISLVHLLHHLQDTLAALRPKFAPAALEEVMRALAATEQTARVPTADSFRLGLDKRDEAFAASVGQPRPVQLLLAVLREGSWTHAAALLEHFDGEVGCSMLAHRHVGLALLARLHAALAPAHAALFPFGPLGPCLLAAGHDLPPAAPLSAEVLQMLQALGPLAFRRTDTLTMLWRVLTHILRTHDADGQPRQHALHAVRHSAFPASCLLACNTSVWALASACLQRLPQVLRCDVFYSGALAFAMEPQDKIHRRSAQKDTLSLLLRQQALIVSSALSALGKKMRLPEDADERHREVLHCSRMLAKLVLSQPLAAAGQILWHCRNFDNYHDIFTEYACSLPPLLRELIVFEGLRFLLCTDADRLGEDGVNVAAWHANMGAFLGKFVTAYDHVDLHVLFLYILQRLRLRVEDVRVVVDVQLLAAVFRHAMGDVLRDLTDEQRAALFCGPVYRAHKLMMPLVSEGVLLARATRLFDAMHAIQPASASLAMPLYICLCQQQSMLCNSVGSSASVKLVFELTEQTHRAVVLYLAFLHRLPLPRLLGILPPLTDLWTKYEIGPECALALYRPVLRQALQAWQPDDAPLVVPLRCAGAGAAPCAEGGLPGLPQLTQDICAVVPKFGEHDGAAYKDPPFDPRFYILFWALELPDLCTNTDDRYKELHKDLMAQLARAKKDLADLLEARKRQERQQARPVPMHRGGYQSTANEAPIVTAADESRAAKLVADVSDKLKHLPAEHAAFVERATTWGAFFAARAQSFFGQTDLKISVSLFFQECILPRCLNSLEDAMFCAHMLRRLADLNTRNYRHAFAMNSVFHEVLALLRCCTDDQANCLGAFLKQTLKLHKECLDRAWFDEHPQYNKYSGDANSGRIDYDNWNKLNKKFHKRISEALSTILQNSNEAGNEVVMRNALKMVIGLIPEWPGTLEAYKIIDGALVGLLETQDSMRDDIEQLAYAAQRELKRVPYAKAAARENSAADKEAAEDGELDDDGAEAEQSRAREAAAPHKRVRDAAPLEAHGRSQRPRMDSGYHGGAGMRSNPSGMRGYHGH